MRKAVASSEKSASSRTVGTVSNCFAVMPKGSANTRPQCTACHGLGAQFQRTGQVLAHLGPIAGVVGDIVLHPGQHIGKSREGLCRVGIGRHAVLPAKAVVGLLQQAAECLRDGVLRTGGSRQRQCNGGGMVLYERTVFRARGLMRSNGHQHRRYRP